MTILEEIKEWLKKGSGEAEDIAELPWDIEEIKGDGEIKGVIAVNPKMPIKLIIIDNKEVNAIRLYASTGIYTADLEPSKKLRVYRKLLSLNKSPLSKIYLEGGDGEIVVAADLSTKSLGEDEFFDTLTFTLNLLLGVYTAFGIPDEVRTEMLENLVWMIKRRIEKGWTREKLEKFLINKVGMNKEDADHLLNSVFPSEGQGARKTGTIYV